MSGRDPEITAAGHTQTEQLSAPGMNWRDKSKSKSEPGQRGGGRRPGGAAEQVQTDGGRRGDLLSPAALDWRNGLDVQQILFNALAFQRYYFLRMPLTKSSKCYRHFLTTVYSNFFNTLLIYTFGNMRCCVDSTNLILSE